MAMAPLPPRLSWQERDIQRRAEKLIALKHEEGAAERFWNNCYKRYCRVPLATRVLLAGPNEPLGHKCI